jgi:hypothetical protein
MMTATGRCHAHCRPKRKAAGQDDAGAAAGMRFPGTEQAVVAALRLSLLQAPVTPIADVRAKLQASRPKTGKRANKAMPDEGELQVCVAVGRPLIRTKPAINTCVIMLHPR